MGSDTYPMLSQPTDGGRRVKQQLLLVNFYFVLAQFQIYRYLFPLIFPTYVLFLHKSYYFIFREFLAVKLF